MYGNIISMELKLAKTNKEKFEKKKTEKQKSQEMDKKRKQKEVLKEVGNG